MFFRRHHCRACGNIFCASCSQYQSTIPELGYFRPTRVCKMCVQRCSSHVTPPHSARKPAFPRSPALPSSKGRSFGRMIENHMSSSPVAAAAGASAVSRKKVALSHHQSVQRNRNDAHPESSSSQRKLIFSSSSQNKDHSSTSAKLGQLTPSTSAVRLWLPDTTSDACHQCQEPFRGGLRRRHHCRSCARVFCNDCSSCTVSSKRLNLLSSDHPSHISETFERVCRRCYSRLLSADSLFGRFSFDSKRMLLIVQWLDIITINSMYRLNVQWHGIMSSDLADLMIWSSLCALHGLTITTTTQDITSSHQAWRNLYLCKVAMKTMSVAIAMLKHDGPIGKEAARSLMILSSSSSSSSSADSLALLQNAMPALMVAVAGAQQGQSTTTLHAAACTLQRACFAAGTLLNCTRANASSCKSLVLLGGIQELLRNGNVDVSLISSTSSMNTMVHVTGTVWNLLRWDHQHNNGTSTSGNSNLFVIETLGKQLQQVLASLESLTTLAVLKHEKKKKKQVMVGQLLLQIATNCTGALAFCCCDKIAEENTPSLRAARVVALSSVLRVLSHVSSTSVSPFTEMERFLRAACSTMRNAILKTTSAQIAMREMEGMFTMMMLLEWKGDTRVAESAAAVMTNATNMFEDLRRCVVVDDRWCQVATHATAAVGTTAVVTTTSMMMREYCAGIMCNCTSCGIELNTTTAIHLENIFISIEQLMDVPQMQNTISSLCGAACNFSLVHSNFIYFEKFQGRNVLKKVVVQTSNDVAVDYATKTLENLVVHDRRK